MKSLTILKTALFMFAFALLMTSCTKENSDTLEDVVEEKYQMEVTVRGSSTTYDAYAAYCNVDGIESFSVSNNVALLGNDLWSEDIVEGDFVIHYRKDESSEFSLGGTIIESTVDGETLKNFTLTDDSLIDIAVDTANETEVLGSMSGNFLVLVDVVDVEFESVPFSVTFAGEVDSDLTPIFCE